MTDPNKRPMAACVGLVLDLIVEFHAMTLFNVDILSALIVWMSGDTTSGQTPGSRYMTNERKQGPYPCKWPACRESFDSMDNCIRHECTEFLRWRATNLSLGLRL